MNQRKYWANFITIDRIAVPTILQEQQEEILLRKESLVKELQELQLLEASNQHQMSSAKEKAAGKKLLSTVSNGVERPTRKNLLVQLLRPSRLPVSESAHCWSVVVLLVATLLLVGRTG